MQIYIQQVLRNNNIMPGGGGGKLKEKIPCLNIQLLVILLVTNNIYK